VAVVHQATLTPSKRDILMAWLPAQPWYRGTGEVTGVDSYRFDDPAGEVGLDTALVGTGDNTILHVPFTYRAEPLAGADDHLIATPEHSVLGTRYFYDGCCDPVWVTAMVNAILSGGSEAEQIVQTDDGHVRREVTMRVRGSGSRRTAVGLQTVHGSEHCEDITVITTDAFEVLVARRIGAAVDAPDVLTGAWADRQGVVLAGVRRRA